VLLGQTEHAAAMAADWPGHPQLRLRRHRPEGRRHFRAAHSPYCRCRSDRQANEIAGVALEDVADRMVETTDRVQSLRRTTKRQVRRRCDESRLDCCSASRTSPETGGRGGGKEREEGEGAELKRTSHSPRRRSLCTASVNGLSLLAAVVASEKSNLLLLTKSGPGQTVRGGMQDGRVAKPFRQSTLRRN